jgi:hypothetical protein
MPRPGRAAARASRASDSRPERQLDALRRVLDEVRPQQRSEVDVANGVGTCWLTTRIISSGVTPLAVIEATNEPADVPT